MSGFRMVSERHDYIKTEKERLTMLDKITVIEHSAIRIKADKTFYFDPFHISGEPRDADVIFITHDHYDHFSPEDIDKVANDGTVFVAPASMAKSFAKQGIADSRVTYLEPGGSAEVLGYAVEAVAAYNILKPFHPKGKSWLGYVVTIDGTRVYVCGDTANTPEAQAVKCDIACVPIGGTYTMNPKSAAELIKAMKPRIAIPTHYGSIVGSPKDADEFERNVGSAAKVVRKIQF